MAAGKDTWSKKRAFPFAQRPFAEQARSWKKGLDEVHAELTLILEAVEVVSERYFQGAELLYPNLAECAGVLSEILAWDRKT